MHPAAEIYQELLGEVDRWFAEAVSRHPGVVPCGAGCSACCHGPFDISMADGLLLREGLRLLPEGARELVRGRAAEQLDRMRAVEPEWGPPWDPVGLGEERFDRLAGRMSDEPCPLLDDEGKCVAYAHRPLVCRIIGMPMVTPEGAILENDCPIQGRFPIYAALEPQVFDLEQWEEREVACLEAAALELRGDVRCAGEEMVVAGAALLDS
jgi:Fe-S-cluster containining protein